MYRCRRLIAIILSLAVMASAFIMVVSADDEDEFYEIFIKINGVSYNIAENIGYSTTLNPGDYINFTFDAINVRGGTISQYQALAVNFNIRCYVIYYSQDFNNTISYLNPIASNYNEYLQNDGVVKFQFFRDFDNLFQPDQLNKNPYGFSASFLFTNSNFRNINVSSKWTNNSQAKITVFWRIEDLNVSNSQNWFNSNVIAPSFNSIITSFTLLNTRLFSDPYSYNEISYDSDGNSSITEKSGNWITAILGTLQSILAPVEKQVEEEQMAKDAGFNDVLGDAYSSSSPGSLIDILDIGDLATWDEGSWEDSMGDSFLYWFSQSCADDIDTVPRTRGEEPQIIDFYSQHINNYWEALGIGTADQGGD